MVDKKDDEVDDWNPGNPADLDGPDAVKLEPHLQSWNEPIDEIETKEGSDDDGLYDPGADDDDARWVQSTYRQREGIRSPTHQAETETEKVQGSDGVLCCPGCFTPVCFQFKMRENPSRNYKKPIWFSTRAENCWVLSSSEVVESPKRRRSSTSLYQTPCSSEAAFKTDIHCKICRTPVGKKDIESSAYIFDNVLPGE